MYRIGSFRCMDACLLTLLLILLAGCAGAQDAARLDSAATVPSADGLPQLPEGAVERAVSYSVVQYSQGSATYSTSPACSFHGPSVAIPAPPEGLEWAMYAFNTEGYDPDSIEAGLSLSANSSCWLGVSDYRRGRWKFYGPLSGDAEIELRGTGLISPAGQFFALVVSHDGKSASCDYLSLRYDNAVETDFSVSGRVLDEEGEPVGGVRISADLELVEAVSDAQGRYYLGLSAAGNYTLTPTSNYGHFVTPISPLVAVDGHESGHDFTATRIDLRGRISIADTDGQLGLGGVPLVLNPGSLTVYTAADGSYEFPGLVDGNYTVEPAFAGYTFEPLGINAAVAGSDLEGQDFEATGGAPTYAIRGNLQLTNGSGLEGALLLLQPGNRQAVSDQNGDYVFFGVGNGTYTVEPRKSFQEFEPVKQSVTVSNNSALDVNFSGIVPPTLYKLSGYLLDDDYSLGIPDALVHIELAVGGINGMLETYTDDSGYYSVMIPAGRYSVIGDKAGYDFYQTYFDMLAGDTTVTLRARMIGGPSWDNFAEEFIIDRCLQCHRPDSSVAASPPLRNYSEVIAAGGSGNLRIQAGTMPPSGGVPELYKVYFQKWKDDGFPEE